MLSVTSDAGMFVLPADTGSKGRFPRSGLHQSFSAFGTAAFQNQSASAIGHSGAESALMRSLDLRRLVRSFHVQFPFSGIFPGLCFKFSAKLMNR